MAGLNCRNRPDCRKRGRPKSKAALPGSESGAFGCSSSVITGAMKRYTRFGMVSINMGLSAGSPRAKPCTRRSGLDGSEDRNSNPEQGNKTDRGETGQQAQALNSCFSTCQAIRVDTRSGDQDRGRRHFQQRDCACCLRHAQDEEIDIGNSHDGRKDINPCFS